jgi:hypothetical protein
LLGGPSIKAVKLRTLLVLFKRPRKRGRALESGVYAIKQRGLLCEDTCCDLILFKQAAEIFHVSRYGALRLFSLVAASIIE